MDAVAHMRNMVHGEALRQEFHQRRWPRQHRVRVPDGMAAALTATAQRQGGLDAFGLDNTPLGLYVDPGIYAETTLKLATEAINTLMSETQVERLVSDPASLLTGPPPDSGRGPLDGDWYRARCGLLAGF